METKNKLVDIKSIKSLLNQLKTVFKAGGVANAKSAVAAEYESDSDSLRKAYELIYLHQTKNNQMKLQRTDFDYIYIPQCPGIPA